MSYPDRSIVAPTDFFGCLLWLDASDSASVIRDGSNLVSQWSDKSGNANHATQAVGANKPTYSAAGLNGRPCLDWGSSPAAGMGLTTPSITYGPFTIFMVLNAVAGHGYPCAHWNAGGQQDYIYRQTASFYVNRAGGASSRNVSSAGGGATWLVGARVLTRRFDGTHAGNIARTIGATLWTPFDAPPLGGGANEGGTATVAGAVAIGNHPSSAEAFRGTIAEVIIFNRALSDGETFAVERYLAQKWALYPGRAISSPLEISGCALFLDAAVGVTAVDTTALVAPNDFGNAAWVANSATVATNVAPDPVGGNAADSITDVVSGAAHHRVRQAVAGIVAGSMARFSCYLKAGTTTWAFLGGNDAGVGVWFNLVDGSIGTQTSALGTVTAVGNGWHLCSIDYLASTSNVDVYLASGNGVAIYAGTGSTSMLMYGAAVSQAIVSQWNDQSGNANHCTSSGTNRPVVSTHNGNVVIRFDGSNDTMVAANNIADATTGSTIVAVCRKRSAAATVNKALFTTQSNGLYLDSATGSNSWGGQNGGFRTAGEQPTTNVRVFSARRYGASLQGGYRVRADGIQKAIYTSGGSDSRATTDVSFSSQAADMDLLALVVYLRPLTDGELGLLEAHFNQKYRLYARRQIASPLELPDCAMWFDASQGVTLDGSNNVAQWNDASGNARHVAQSTANQRPGFTASNALFGGKSTVDWTSVGASIYLDRLAADNLAQPVTIFVCASVSNASATNIGLLVNVSGSDLSIQRLNGTTWQYFGGVAALSFAPPPVSEPFVISVGANPTVRDSYAKLNGVCVVRGGGGSNAMGTLRIGSMYNGFQSQNWNGSIAEVIVFSRRLSDGEVALVEQYFASKYTL